MGLSSTVNKVMLITPNVPLKLEVIPNHDNVKYSSVIMIIVIIRIMIMIMIIISASAI